MSKPAFSAEKAGLFLPHLCLDSALLS